MVSGAHEPVREPTDLPSFAERLLALLDEGRKTTTYKLALLLAIMDACVEGTDDTGRPPTSLATLDLADRVAELYWPQLLPYADAGPLRQSSNSDAKILNALAALREAFPRTSTWAAATELDPVGVAHALDVIEWTLCRYPVLLLQKIGDSRAELIYETPPWTESVGMSALAGAQLVLLPGAADHLIRLAPLVRPLVELLWVRKVAALNRLAVPEDDVRRHLFGAERVAFPSRLRRHLVDLQHGECFYCGDRLGPSSPLDHFIPWSRWPNDAVENLVVADGRCNSQKSNRLPGVEPLQRWADRLRHDAGSLRTIATDARWRTQPERTVALVRGIYAHLPAGTPLWLAHNAIDLESRPADLVAMLAGLP